MFLKVQTAWQQKVRIMGGRRQCRVDDHDGLALFVVQQDGVHLVDAAVLVRQAVPRVVPDEFDRRDEPFASPDACRGGGHLLVVVDGLIPVEAGEFRLHGIFQRGEGRHGKLVSRVFARPGIPALNAHVAGEYGEHTDGAGNVFPVGGALRAPALTDEARPGPGDLAGQLFDTGRGNPGDARGPCRSLWRLVRALPQNVGFVG